MRAPPSVCAQGLIRHFRPVIEERMAQYAATVAKNAPAAAAAGAH